ncbi:hypothetical protein [Rhodococcus erythropolis]|uniref:hypothetical protein n=1 Tax=Rhodococcus erythropolis TaxID=1833 RepID=UPI0008C9494B|nr:hypothetical protein [Rhodococcus erythropolis]OFV76950.1 hypothetical protein RERY_24010 [Rhodococcus erythropolis]
MNQQTEEWMARARTPQARARIRRWSRWEDISLEILLTGTVAFVAAIPIGVGLAIGFWIAGVDRSEVFYWLYGSSVAVLLIGAVLDAVTGSRLAEARFADGQLTIGRIEEVIQLPSNDADMNPTYDLAVRAEPPGHPVLRRTIGWGSGDSSGPDDRWVGRAIRIRHNTLDPNDLHDALFAGWDERAEPDETIGGGR